MSDRTDGIARTLTPCGARVCTGCATCVKAWAAGERLDLAPWQAALVDRIYRPAPDDGDDGG